uniref:Fibronectin type-III domain-containing protein n=1 Tax=Macrostomum lignano TaxID=282301 RepID=A0A1I8GPT7_9PLAT
AKFILPAPTLTASGCFKQITLEPASVTCDWRPKYDNSGCYYETSYQASSAKFILPAPTLTASGCFKQSSYQNSAAIFVPKVDVTASGCLKELSFDNSSVTATANVTVAASGFFSESSFSSSVVKFTDVSTKVSASGCFHEESSKSEMASSGCFKEIQRSTSSARFLFQLPTTASGTFNERVAVEELKISTPPSMPVIRSMPIVDSGCEFVGSTAELISESRADERQVQQQHSSSIYALSVGQSSSASRATRTSEAQTDLNYKSALWNMFVLKNGRVDVNLSFIVSYFGVEAFAREYMLLREFRNVATQVGEGGEVGFATASPRSANLIQSRSFESQSSASRVYGSGVVNIGGSSVSIGGSDGEMLDLSSSFATRLPSVQRQIEFNNFSGAHADVSDLSGVISSASGTSAIQRQSSGRSGERIVTQSSGSGIVNMSETVSSGSRGFAVSGDGLSSVYRSVSGIDGSDGSVQAALASMVSVGESNSGITRLSTLEGRMLNLSD